MRALLLTSCLVVTSVACTCGPGDGSVNEQRRDAGSTGGSGASGGSPGASGGGTTAGGGLTAGGVAGGNTAGGGGVNGGGPSAGGAAAGGDGSAGGGSAGGGSAGGGPTNSLDGGFRSVVYGHSSTTLYTVDPVNKQVAKVGDFTCASDVTDLAIDSLGNAFIVGITGFHRLNLADASCVTILNTPGVPYPNSLSFVPRGTLQPNAETLVAYAAGNYYRVDPNVGTLTQLGSLPTGFESSGDIVSVQDGGTFLTVKNMSMMPPCNDCLVQVSPINGALIRNYGPLPYTRVFGIAYWGGSVYGFTSLGEVFEVAPQGNGIVTRRIPIVMPPRNLSFFGAGSSTLVPVAAEDGGKISID